MLQDEVSAHSADRSHVRDRSRHNQRPIFGFMISTMTRSEVVNALLEPVQFGMGVRLVATANVDHVVHLRHSKEFLLAYKSAWIATADGMPVFAYARSRGIQLPERVTGADVYSGLLAKWSPSKHRLYFLVSSEEVAQRTSTLLQSAGFRSEQLVFEVPPFNFALDGQYTETVSAQIRAHNPTHLVMGVGAPQSEIWVTRLRNKLGDVYVVCVGAGIEFSVGLKKRAPCWMQRFGLEWFWRFASEPRRLFNRYFVRAWGLVPAIINDIINEGY